MESGGAADLATAKVAVPDSEAAAWQQWKKL
jgi:hypothetical protein